MTRRACRATQAEVTRAIRAAQAAGLPVFGVQVDGSRVTVLTTAQEQASSRDLDRDAAEIARALGLGSDGKHAPAILSR